MYHQRDKAQWSRKKSLGGTVWYRSDTDRYQYYVISNDKRIYADRGEFSTNYQPEIEFHANESKDSKDDIEFSTDLTDDVPF